MEKSVACEGFRQAFNLDHTADLRSALMSAGASNESLLLALLCGEADGVGTKDIRALGPREFIKVITAQAEMIIVRGAGQGAIAVVLPRAGAPLVVGDDDDVEILRRHIQDVLIAQVADAFEIPPARMRMKIADD